MDGLVGFVQHPAFVVALSVLLLAVTVMGFMAASRARKAREANDVATARTAGLRRQLEAVLASARDGVVVTSAVGDIVMMSEAAGECLGVSPAEAIGRPVPGGALRLGPVDAAGVGELLYSGPNVMLGYAERSSDLSLGRTVRELATGDLARQGADGLFEVVGRQSRFAKVFGLRLDLQVLEQALAAQGLTAWATGAGDSTATSSSAECGSSMRRSKRTGL